MFRAALFWTLLLLVLAIAWWRGDRDARIAAAICAVASVASLYRFNPIADVGLPVHPTIAAIDVVTLIALTLIAIKSQHFWPLWIAGLQLTTTFSHVIRVFYPTLMDVAYDAAMRLWSYPLLIILGVAAWRGREWQQPRRLA